MAHEDHIITSSMPREFVRGMDAIMQSKIPLRILCPKCKEIYLLYIKDLDQGLHCLLGQACPHCKRFITEKDDPEKLLIDAAEMRKFMTDDDEPDQKGKIITGR